MDDFREADSPYGMLRRSEAEFRLGPTPATHAAVVAGAVRLLSAGMDTPNLRVLAGEDRSDSQDLLKYLDATLADLGQRPLDVRGALLLLMEAAAADLVAGRLDATDAGRLLWRIWYPRGAESNMGPAAESLADQVDDFHHRFKPVPTTAEDLVKAAKAFIHSRPRVTFPDAD